MKKILQHSCMVLGMMILFLQGTSAQVYPDVYYRFDATGVGNDTLLTDVFGNYDAVRMINYTWRPDSGKYNGALRFDGTTEVDLSHDLEDNIFNMGYREKTVALWFKADSPSENGMIYYDGPGNSNMGIRLLDGKLEGVVTAGDNPASPKIRLVSTPFTSSDWSHVALVFDHGQVRLFLNGDLAASGSLGTDTVIGLQQKQARLGYKTSGWSPFRQEEISANAVYNFKGLMDEFMLFTKSLDSDNIKEIMKGDTATVRPAAPTNLTATTISYDLINLSWSDNADNELGYRILARTGHGTYQLAGEVPSNTNHFSHTRLYPDSTYYYQVFAFNFLGNSDSTNVASATTLPPPPAPAAPDGLTATAFDFRTINLSWNDNADNEQGFMLLSSKNNGEFTVVADLPANTVSFSDTLLEPNTQYDYKLFAYNPGGNSDTLETQISTPPQPSVEGIAYPYDAGVINVKDHGVYGDGTHDDTQALQEILNTYTGIIYFPEGTYLISNTLTWVSPARNITFQGQSKEKTILKLKDNADGFQNTVITKAMIWTGEAPAQRFRNYIKDMTFNTGTGNPGAIGMQFIANNAGGIFNVDIISGDGQGMIGLDLGYTNEQGPCLIKNVTITGFAVGISTKGSVDSIVLEHVTLKNQTQAGFMNSGQCLSIRGLVSENTVPAFINQGANGVVTLIDCSFTNGQSDNYAIENAGVMLVRNLHTAGYLEAIQNTAGNKYGEEGPDVDEWVSHPVITLHPTEERTLGLPIAETPEVPWENDFTNWISVVKCGAIPDDGEDDTQAIQAAMDSGMTTVYFPKGSYNIDGTVEIGGNVRRVIGCESRVEIPQQEAPAFKLIDGTYDTVVFEQFSHFGYNFQYTLDNASARTLVIRNCSALSGKFTGTGDVFIEDVVSNIASQFVFNDQNVWARQLNIESRNGTTHLVNNGGNTWILGYKTENKGTQIENKNGGNLEMLGGFFYSVGTDYTDPMIINDNANICVTMGESNYGSSPFDTLVMEAKGSDILYLTKDEAPNRGAASMLPLYVGRTAVTETLESPSDLSAEAVSASEIDLSWTDNSSTALSFRIERKKENGIYREIATVDVSNTTYTDENLDENTVYYYRVKAIGSDFNSGYSNEASSQTFAVSVGSPDEASKIRIYPNPVSDALSVRSTGKFTIRKIIIYDSYGKIIDQIIPGEGTRDLSIPVNTFAPGVYSAKIITGNNISVKRFLKL